MATIHTKVIRFLQILQASIGRRREKGKSHGIISGCSIYILDVNDIAKKHGLPQCDLGNVVVDARTQVRLATFTREST